MTAQIINGEAIAKKIRENIAQEILTLKTPPGLAVILVGSDPASQNYVNMKEKNCLEVGFQSFVKRLPAETTEKELLKLIKQLNTNDHVHGILVQLPLPDHINELKVIMTIAPEKDVDGFHPINAGKLLVGDATGLVPCTPAGVVELIKSTGVELKGKHAVVIGRSNIVGKPVALLLLQEHCTVTICHSRTQDLAAVVRSGDIVVAAVGKAKLVTGDMIKPGAIVIDVGTNRVDGKLTGDVVFDEVSKVAGYITPVPGGVGPMTRAYLLKNTMQAYKNLARS